MTISVGLNSIEDGEIVLDYDSDSHRSSVNITENSDHDEGDLYDESLAGSSSRSTAHIAVAEPEPQPSTSNFNQPIEVVGNHRHPFADLI